MSSFTEPVRAFSEIIYVMGSNPLLRQAAMPTLARTDAVLDEAMAEAIRTGDAVLYQVSASWDDDPATDLERFARRSSR